jgi:hypothetical protein
VGRDVVRRPDGGMAREKNDDDEEEEEKNDGDGGTTSPRLAYARTRHIMSNIAVVEATNDGVVVMGGTATAAIPPYADVVIVVGRLPRRRS